MRAVRSIALRGRPGDGSGTRFGSGPVHRKAGVIPGKEKARVFSPGGVATRLVGGYGVAGSPPLTCTPGTAAESTVTSM